MRQRNNRWIFIFLFPSILIFCFIYAIPLVTLFVSSFTEWNGYEKMKFIGIANYAEMLKDDNFRSALVNSVKWSMWAAFVHVPLGVMIAMVLAKKPRGWRFTRAVYMIPNIIAPTAMAILFMFIYKPDAGILNWIVRLFGFKNFNLNWLYDPRTAFISVTFIWLPYAAVIVLITMAELLSVPQSIYESAKIDGASNIMIDLYINLPLLWKIIGTGVIIAITSTLRKFDIIFLTTNGGPGNLTMNLTVMMYNSIFNNTRYGYANALAAVLLIIGMLFILISTNVFKMDRSLYE